RGERLDAVREVVALGVGGRGGTVAGGFEAGVRAIGGTDTRCQGDGPAKNRGRDGDLCDQRAGADELCGVSSPGVADQQCAGGERDQAIESACEGNGKVLDQRRRRVDASDSRSDPERGWPCGALCPSAPTARSRRGRQPAWTATEVRTSTGLHPDYTRKLPSRPPSVRLYPIVAELYRCRSTLHVPVACAAFQSPPVRRAARSDVPPVSRR